MTPTQQLQLALKVIKEDWDTDEYDREKFRYLTVDMGIPIEMIEQAIYMDSVKGLKRHRGKNA